MSCGHNLYMTPSQVVLWHTRHVKFPLARLVLHNVAMVFSRSLKLHILQYMGLYKQLGMDYNCVTLSNILSVIIWYKPQSNSTLPTELRIGALIHSHSHERFFGPFVWTGLAFLHVHKLCQYPMYKHTHTWGIGVWCITFCRLLN